MNSEWWIEKMLIKRKNKKGFTLLEVLISIGILATMMLSVTQITDGILSKKERNDERMSLHHSVVITVTKIKDDLNMAFLADSKFQGKNAVYKSGFLGAEDSMNFSTMSNVHFHKNKAETDQNHVGYFIEKNDRGYFDLKRRQTDYLLDDLEKGGESFILLRDVSEFELEYYDSNKKDWQQKWDTGSASAAGKLPQIVKVKFTKMGEEEADERDRKEHYYEFLVEVPMYNTKISF